MTATKTTTIPARIQAAIDMIDAVQVSPRRWEYAATETQETYRLTLSDLRALADLMEDDDPRVRYDAYSHWCAGGYGRIVG